MLAAYVVESMKRPLRLPNSSQGARYGIWLDEPATLPPDPDWIETTDYVWLVTLYLVGMVGSI